MTRPAFVPWILFKEIRALWVPWIVLALPVAVLTLGFPWRGFGLVGFFLYCPAGVVLGAWSMGHEYADRTVGALLGHPVSRGRLFSAKLGVLITLQFALAAMVAVPVLTNLNAGRSVAWAVIALPLLCGIGIAPWITLACRSAMAGAVFALVLPGLLLVIGERVESLGFGIGGGPGSLRMALVWYGTLAAGVVGVPLSWRAFTRLEDAESRGGGSRPGTLGRRQAVPGSGVMPYSWFRVLRSLVAKEIRLQHLTAVFAGIYCCSWLAVTLFRAGTSEMMAAFGPITLFYASLLALLGGALSCAEERGQGVLELQLLQPVPMAVQWAVKMATVTVTLLLLGVGMPLVLATVLPGLRTADLNVASLSRVMLGLGGIAVYVSSLSPNGFQALVRAIGAAVAGLMLYSVVLYGYGLVGAVRRWEWMRSALDVIREDWGMSPQFVRTLLASVPWAFAAGFFCLALAVGLTNYRYTDRSRLRTALQLLALVVVAGSGVLLVLLSSELRYATR